MEQGLPFLVRRRTAETDRVGFERIPFDEQEIPIRVLCAVFGPVRAITGRCPDDRLSFFKRGFKGLLLTWSHLEHRVFQHPLSDRRSRFPLSDRRSRFPLSDRRS